MKKFIAVLVAFTLGLSTCVFAACGTDDPSGEVNPPSTEQPEPKPDAAKYSAQIEKAGEVYGNFVSASKINGGLFVNKPSGATAVKTRAADGEETAVTVEAIRKIIKKYDSGTSAVFTNIFNSYVCDIFSYMQAQTAIIEEYGVNSLINEYKLTYDGLDLSDANISDGQKEWLPQVLPIAASFPGADLETGRVYCELTHLAEQTREKVCTSLEYYYASAGDMGVTTVNRHYGDDGEPYSFEYHYCDLANGTILFGEGDFEGEEINVNNIWTITFRTWNMNSSIYSEDDKAAIIAFIRSEAERIYGQIDHIKVQNDAIKSDLDIDKDEIVKACNVAVDVSVLNAMLISSEQPKPEPEPKPDANKYSAQLDRAQELYGEIYAVSERNGGLFAKDGAYAVGRASVDESVNQPVTAETVKDILKKYYSTSPSSKTELNSYVTDIFTYMQVQTAILNEYELGALINSYNFTYDGFDLSGVNLGGVSPNWFKKVLPTKASFPGADLETGRIYCEHSHISGMTGENVDTELEYYCDENGSMGVTTLNIHYKRDGSISKFEYDFFDFKLGYVLVAEGSMDGDGNINLRAIKAYSMEYRVNANIISPEDKDIIFSRVYSETERIYSKIGELKAANAAVESELGVEKDETPKSCNVTFDFDALQSMLIK